jgi:TolB-like protein/DNA-binding winged helix-turn-helix (wHTH) protein/Flp pilus assembly protein TadD
LEPAKVKNSVRFGENLELDLSSGQLCRAGRVLKIERIPVAVLLLLVQRRGEVVSREQIVEMIWGKDVYLDTDNAINGAIRKIRQVLRDDPEQPRFIQTITGKGYRFIAPVIAPDAEAQAPPVIAAQQSDGSEASANRFLRNRKYVLGVLLLAVAILAIVSVVIYPAFFGLRAWSSHAGGRTMLAVLPFENLTGDANQEYFSDGMTEEMITQLGSLDPDQMGVIARTSVMHYKHSQEPLPQIARELGVEYVLEGSVRRDADKLRITAQLIQMRDQTHLWARQYDRAATDVLVVQSEIASQISDEIQKALGERKPIAPAPQPVLSPQAFEAYTLYLKGQYFLNKRTKEGFQDAIGYFQQATLTDPADARAYAALAGSYALWAAYSGAPPAEFAPQARAAALRAVQLNDRLPEGHAALALIVQNHDYDWQNAEKEFKKAIALNPNYATAHHWYAEHLAWRGRFEEAFRESERARQLDPLSLIIASDYGAILYYSRQYDKAIAQFGAVREMDPHFSRAALVYQPYVERGMFAEAEAVIQNQNQNQKQKPSDGRWYHSSLAYVYGRSGRRDEAQAEIKKLLDVNREQPMDPVVLVQAYIGMGDNDQTLAWLEKAFAQHSNGLTGLKVDPMYDPVRDKPQFQNILARVGLAQ